VCSIEYLTTQIELVLPTFFQLLDRSHNHRIFNVRDIVYLKYLSQYNSLLFDPSCTVLEIIIVKHRIGRRAKLLVWATLNLAGFRATGLVFSYSVGALTYSRTYLELLLIIIL